MRGVTGDLPLCGLLSLQDSRSRSRTMPGGARHAPIMKRLSVNLAKPGYRNPTPPVLSSAVLCSARGATLGAPGGDFALSVCRGPGCAAWGRAAASPRPFSSSARLSSGLSTRRPVLSGEAARGVPVRRTPRLAAAASTATQDSTADARVGDAGGTIADLFVNLGKEVAPMEARFADLKQQLRDDHGLSASALRDAWRRLEVAMAETSATLRGLDRPSDIIPSVRFSDLVASGGFTEEQAEEVRRVGSVVIRGVVDVDTALTWKQRVRDYYAAHAGSIVTFPEDDPTVYELYWTPPQVEARQHVSTLLASAFLNRLWLRNGAAADAEFSAHPLAYCDRLRIRNPGDAKFALGPHVDGGGIERWEDEDYRKVYTHVLSGDWEAHDAFSPTFRTTASMDLYQTPNACTAFRTFQGWMALSYTGPGEGTLRVHPNVQQSTAYLMLRPFLEDVDATDFPGAIPRTSMDVNERFHGPICEQMVSVPEVAPGDMVWWNGDVVHAVESRHGGAADSSVFYIPAVPACALNAQYLRRQREHFLDGRTPPDFPQNNSEAALDSRATEADLSPLGRVAMGVDSWSAADASDPAVAAVLDAAGPPTGKVLEECDAVLGMA